MFKDNNAEYAAKILDEQQLIEKVAELRRQGRKVVQVHGKFNVVHHGVINHLVQSKEQGDVLVVTVIKDRATGNGAEGSPFHQNWRIQIIASLIQVDYACLVDWADIWECASAINPDVIAYNSKDLPKLSSQSIGAGDQQVCSPPQGVAMFQTKGFTTSFSQVIQDFIHDFPQETQDYLQSFTERYSFQDILHWIDRFKNKKVLLLGDAIIDEYDYCVPLGKSAKAHLVVNKYLHSEVFIGGVLAVANHLASFCDQVHLVTALGSYDSKEQFCREKLSKNVSPFFLSRKDCPTTVKKRYLNENNQKVFEINFINDKDLDPDCESETNDYLQEMARECDMLLVNDFGHGLINSGIIDTIGTLPIAKAVNAQVNGANTGYNLITKYHGIDYVCLDEVELRLSVQDKFGDIAGIANRVKRHIDSPKLVVTMGKNGCLGMGPDGIPAKAPILSKKVVDTVGAGDAFFAYTAPCALLDMPMDLLVFLGNAVGALAVQILGNKKPVEKEELLEFVYNLLR